MNRYNAENQSPEPHNKPDNKVSPQLIIRKELAQCLTEVKNNEAIKLDDVFFQ